MQQSTTLRRLEQILSNAIKNGKKDETAGKVLLDAMNLSQPQDLVELYELLNKVKYETKRIENNSLSVQYLEVLEELQTVFITSHIWAVQWPNILNHIRIEILFLY